MNRRFLVFALVVGLAATAWLSLRSVRKPGEQADRVSLRSSLPQVSGTVGHLADSNEAPTRGNADGSKPEPEAPAPLQSARTGENGSYLGPSGGAGETPRVAVRRVLAEHWLDPGTKNSRRRVRVVETDFKYPLLRIEDEVVRAPDGSEHTVFRQAAVADHVMVGLKPGASEVPAKLVEAGWQVRALKPGLFVLVEVPDPADRAALPAAVEELRRTLAETAYVETDPMVWAEISPNDPKFTSGALWGLDNPGRRSGHKTDADIDGPEGWDVRREAPATVVAVVDSGIRYTHEDLAANLWTNPAEIPGNGLDDDANGVVDDIHGYDAANEDGDPMDDQGHGTHCAGTIGAVGNNGKGITGVAWKVKLMAVKFLTASGGGTTSDAILAIDYARQEGADVINASWGGGPLHAGLLAAIKACGDEDIAFVAAAGNDGTNNDSTPHYPSNYRTENLIAVAATGPNDKLASFSCYGLNSVDLAAPGVDIVSTFYTSDQAYKSLSGTSMAAPHVSGMLALARAGFPNDSVAQLMTRLILESDKLSALATKVGHGGGRANLQKLLDSAAPGGPGNDRLANAGQMSGTDAFWSGTNLGATREPGESSFNPANGARTVWLAWEAPAAGVVDLIVDADPDGHGLRVVVFRKNQQGELTAIADSEETAEKSGSARLRFRVITGNDYRIVIASDADDGQFLTAALTLRPPNDNLADAATVEEERFSIAGTTAGASAEPFELTAPHAGIGVGKSVWWKWTAPFTGPFVLTTEGSEFDTVLAVYQRGEVMGPPVPVASNDDAGPLDGASALEFQAAAEETYLIAIDSYRIDAQGPCKLNGLRPGPPQILSQPADIEVALGGRAAFSVGAAGALQLSYQWFKGDSALPGQRSKTLVIDPVKDQDLGGYSLEVSNGRETTTSRTALLKEKRLPPVITWNSGNVAVLAGGTIDLRVEVSGSQPMSFQWTKDGTVMEGRTASFLTVNDAKPANTGVYACTATNSAGSAAATLVVSVVQSPFDSLTWSRDSVPNSPITDLKVIGGKCYAVAGERILVSDDARQWTPWMLPSGFEGAALAKLGTSWYCSGIRLDGNHSMAISADGVTWQAPAIITGLDSESSTHGVPMLQMEAFGGRLVAINSKYPPGTITPDVNVVYHSANGMAWTKTQRRNTDNLLTTFSTSNRFFAWGDKLYLPAGKPGPNSSTNATVLISTDGMTWEETPLPAAPNSSPSGSGAGMTSCKGVLYLFSDYGIFSSPDAVAWSFRGFRPQGGATHMRFAEASDGCYGFYVQNQVFAFGSSPLDWASTSGWNTSTLQPALSHNFSCAVSFQGAAVFGTSSGLLRRVDDRGALTLTAGTAWPLQAIRFVNDEFIAYRPISNWQSPGPLLVSGDGQTWRPGRSFSSTSADSNFIANVNIGGRYLGLTLTSSVPAGGWAPSAMSVVSPPAGVTGGVVSTASDGTRWLALVAGDGVFQFTPDGGTWTKLAATGYIPRTTDTLLRFKSRWYVCSPNDATKLRMSGDGLTWTAVPDVAPALIALFGEKLCGVSEDGLTCFLTTDGVTWQSLPIGMGIGNTGGGSSLVRSHRLQEFNGSLVLLARETYSDRGFLFFTNDARTWLRAAVTTRIRDFAVGKGVLAAVTTNGGVILARGSVGLGSAPLTAIASPRHRSSHVLGSTVDITGTVVDPEGQEVTTECFVDGISLGTTVGGTFRFSFRPSNPAGHVVTVRSRDPQNLFGSDEALVSVTAPQLPNLLESQEGKTYIPLRAWTSFGGYAYAAGPYALYRSRGDGTWEPVVLPILPAAITNIVSGNGTLIIQTSAAALLTRDGVNWWQLNDLGKSSWSVAGPLAFKAGWFVGTTRGNEAAPFYSRDGLSWTFGEAVPSGSLPVNGPVVTPDGSLLASLPFRSVDGGLNWLAIPEFTGLGETQIQFATAFGAVCAGLADGRVFRSVNDGATWQMVAQFPALPTGHHARISLQAGRLFWGGGGAWLATSRDGVAWEALSGSNVLSSNIETIGGRFVGFGRDSMVWSLDGVVWQTAPTSPANAVAGMLTADPEDLLLGDSSGGLWRTRDGLEWIRLMPGKAFPQPPASLGSATATRIRIGGQTVVGWSGGNFGNLYRSGNGGLDWQYVTYQGGPMPATVDAQKLWTDGTTAFASVRRSGASEGSGEYELWRSRNGIDWTRIWAWPSGAIQEMTNDGSTWLCLATNGDLRRSTDDGSSWSAEALPGLITGWTLSRFRGVWIAIGAEMLDLAMANIVYASPDGVTWTRRGALGSETGSNTVTSSVSDTAIVVVSASGKVFTATDENLLWINTATLARYSFPAVPLIERVGAKFCIRDRVISSDGITWTAPSITGQFTPRAYFAGVYLTFPGSQGARWSLDGLILTGTTGTSTLPSNPLFDDDSTALRARDNTGATWATTDGKAWTLAAEGPPDTTGVAFARQITAFGQRLVAAGTAGLVVVSQDDGKSWLPATFGGRAFPSAFRIRDLETSPSEVLAIFNINTNTFPPVCRYFRSTDGSAWNEIPALGGLGLVDIVWAAGKWMGIRTTGDLVSSGDGGLTWSPAGTVSGAVGGRNLSHLNGLWVATGPIITGVNKPLSFFTSPDGVTWTDRGTSGLNDSTFTDTPMMFFRGHGLLFFGLGPESKQSADGLTWTPMGKGGSLSGVKWMVPVANGYVAFNTSSSESYFWNAPVDGGSWALVAPYQNQISGIGSLNSSRLFLFGPGTIKEWTRADLALSINDPAKSDFGVGDKLEMSVTLRNPGSQAMTPGDPLPVDAWLSSDGFFGDGNDVYVGRVDLPAAPPAPGAEATFNLVFVLPDTIEPGTHHVVLRLDTQGRLDEINRANNTALTRTAVVNIPQWQLGLVTQGSGEVVQTSARRFYPHKSSIGLFARAGKGAAFAGWGGDAVGGLSETSVLMDGDKNVTATFTPQASLRIGLIGNGTLNVPVSGAVPLGSQLVLIATPAAGWEFDRWDGAVSGTAASVPLTVNGNKVARAFFRQTITGWKQRYFHAAELTQPSISGNDADPDGDGVLNWQEFAHGSNPLDAGSTGRGTIGRDGNEMVVVFTRHQNPADGTRVECQAARGLDDWGPEGLVTQVLDQSAGVDTLEVRFPITGRSRGFIRFAYTRPAP